MDSIIQLVREIRAQPGNFIPWNSITCLDAYLYGWLMRGDRTANDIDSWDNFDVWIRRKYSSSEDHKWPNVLLFFSTDEASALELFFTEFTQFEKESISYPQSSAIDSEKTIVDLIAEIKRRPGLYVAGKTIMRLRSFIDGWLYRDQGFIQNAEVMKRFQVWVSRRFRMAHPKHWSEIILYFSMNEFGAFDSFIKEFDAFIEKENGVVHALRKEIDTNGADGIPALYQLLKSNNEIGYDFSEIAVNDVAYSYIDTDLRSALALFKLNVDQYPHSNNVYDSYAEALLKNNQTDLAIENYKKSIALHPGNIAAIKILENFGIHAGPVNVDVPESALERYVGTYEYEPTFNFVITRSGTQVFFQDTRMPKFEMFATSYTEFYLKDAAASIWFNIREEQVDGLTVRENGENTIAKKIS